MGDKQPVVAKIIEKFKPVFDPDPQEQVSGWDQRGSVGTESGSK